MERNTEILRACALFAPCAEEVLDGLARASRTVDLCRGEMLFSTGDAVRQMYVTEKGRLTVTAHSKRGTAHLKTIGAHEVVGISTLFGERGEAVSTVCAKTDARLLCIGQDALEAALLADPALALRYIACLTERVRFLNDRIATFTSKDAESRLARYLLEHAGHSNRFRLTIPFSTLAYTLDIGRASLYRALDTLRADGCVVRDGQEFRLDRAAMQKYIDT